jgi:diaminohydroxyphosphoribosylaminopyrimidine deaminase/5-amino-6-(5-phosphoribosylamino)uracil reductase
LKLASTLDGRIADRFGQSRYISGKEGLAYVHDWRNRLDCVLIGNETARKDNPELTVRGVENGRNPDRAVLDTQLSLPSSSKLFADHKDGSRTFLFCSERLAMSEKIQTYPAHVSVVPIAERRGDTNQLDIHSVLKSLALAGVNSVLCEGGAGLATTLIEDRLADEVKWIVAPKLLGDGSGICALNSGVEVKLADVLTLKRVRISQLGEDALIEGVLAGCDLFGDT